MNQKGFTIVELMVATTVFAVLLLIVTFAVLRIGQVYYKGLNMSRTQDITRNILEEVSQSIQLSGGDVNPISPVGESQGAYCIGDRSRFVYRLNSVQEAGGESVLSNYDITSPCTTISDIVTGNQGRALLGENMRVVEFDITPLGNRIYSVNLKIAYGEDDLLDDQFRCEPGFGSQFCATSDLSTVIGQRL